MIITVKKKDGTTERFEENRGPGSNSVKYQDGWAIITDEFGAVTAFPSELIAEIKCSEPRGRW